MYVSPHGAVYFTMVYNGLLLCVQVVEEDPTEMSEATEVTDTTDISEASEDNNIKKVWELVQLLFLSLLVTNYPFLSLLLSV